ncbi:PREDICTED: programmed cell death 1 ligand 2 isoform X8 [Bison bison bison]|uniref:Programmed cell death 1 ligand 2 isoform X8 n=1 Tax=Bison bison bison TaxID=43346 RepID=A0A6P3GRI6_BISBB|nr:PREDICTED: programmed cell death 1 ligand 2 isoform X8 [Bison bison bison]
MMRLPQSDPVQSMFLLLILSLGLQLQQTVASYKKINTRHLKVPGTDEVELTCQAEGYPLAEVSWPNISIPTNTSHTKTSEGLYQVTSVLRLKPHPGRNFSCVFWNANVKELTSATIVQGPLEDPKIPSSSLLHVFILSLIVAPIFIATVVALRKRLCQKLYSGEDSTKRSATMVRREVDRALQVRRSPGYISHDLPQVKKGHVPSKKTATSHLSFTASSKEGSCALKEDSNFSPQLYCLK